MCIQVENPIPFEDSAITRALSIGMLHSRYAALLLAPAQLSADWSYACVPLIRSFSDPRNLETAALYMSLLGLLLASKSYAALWKLLRGRASSSCSPAASWAAVVVFGLIVSLLDAILLSGTLMPKASACQPTPC